MPALDAHAGHVSLTDVLDAVAGAGEGKSVSVFDIVKTIGPRGFGPLLLVPALIITSPASGIPGLSSVGGMIIALIAAQYLIGRDHVWLPKFLGARHMSREALGKAVGFLHKPARLIDTILARRLPFVTARPFSLILAGACLVIGAIMPLFELIPFSSSLLAGVVVMLSLALTTRDGVLALVGYAALAAAGYAIARLTGVI